jgi:putative hemolysin
MQSTQLESTRESRRKNRYQVAVARTRFEVEAAQRLRYQVFFEEMGAEAAQRIREAERDEDAYDSHCDHLIVRDAESDMVVGCYRIMRPDAAQQRGGYYSDSEFDLTRLAHLRPRMAEVGRACIHPHYRSGTVIMLLWSGLARFMVEAGYEYVIGCASIPLAEGRENALAVYAECARRALAPAEYRVFPRHAYPLPSALTATPIEESSALSAQPAHVPPLIKGYLRLGAWIGGAPAWDPEFNTADLFVLLPLSRMSGGYARHFLGQEAAYEVVNKIAVAA